MMIMKSKVSFKEHIIATLRVFAIIAVVVIFCMMTVSCTPEFISYIDNLSMPVVLIIVGILLSVVYYVWRTTYKHRHE